MNKLPSSSGIALIASIGVVAVSMIGFTAYKYMGNNAEEQRDSSFISERPSSEFILRDTDISEVEEEKYEPTKYNLSDKNKANYGHVKIIGGKRSKKRKRKNKSKKRNTLKK